MLKEHSLMGNLKIISEQNGIPETEFKNRMIKVFGESEMVEKAFLVKAVYDNNTDGVFILLCLKVNSGFQKDLLNKIADIFSSMFNKEQFLDILLIGSVKQETQLEKAARPFFMDH